MNAYQKPKTKNSKLFFTPWLLFAAVLLLSGWMVAAADQERVIRVLDRGDLAVMEFHLRHQGHRVRVESGELKQIAGEVRAVLECRTENGGVAFTWDYPLGGDARATLAGRW
jgi:hypothetical protein